MYTYIHIYLHACIHYITYIHSYIHVDTGTKDDIPTMATNIYILPLHTYMHTYTHTYIHTYIRSLCILLRRTCSIEVGFFALIIDSQARGVIHDSLMCNQMPILFNLIMFKLHAYIPYIHTYTYTCTYTSTYVRTNKYIHTYF